MESRGLVIYWRDYLTKRYGRNVSINIHRFYTEMDILFTNKRKSLLVTVKIGEENEYVIEVHNTKKKELPNGVLGIGLDDLSASMKKTLATVDKELGFNFSK